jgi:hypothetical protein
MYDLLVKGIAAAELAKKLNASIRQLNTITVALLLGW